MFFIDDANYTKYEGQDKLQRILMEAQYVQPTIVSSTPRLWNALYSQFQAQVSLCVQQEPDRDAGEIRQEHIMKYRTMLGWRLRLASIGGGKGVIFFFKT